MSIGEVAEEALKWLGRALAVLPAFRGFWEAVQGGNPNQEFAAQMELRRAIRHEQAKAEILSDEPIPKLYDLEDVGEETKDEEP